MIKKKIRYGSVCSGVECATLAWEHLGWELVFVSEVEPFPCSVLQQRFDCTPPIHPLNPSDATNDKDRKEREQWLRQINKMPNVGTIPNEGDFSKIGDKYAGKYDLLIGGTPCQSFSIAGKRAGLSGVSGLALEYIRLAYESEVRWLVWENVPGCFSTNNGGDFAAFLSGLAGCQIEVPEQGWSSAGIVPNFRKDRYGLAWRVLDAQYVRVDGFPHAVPQRRRRVFVVGYFGDWRCAAKVLFERDGLFGDSPPRRKSKQDIATNIGECLAETGGAEIKRDCIISGTTIRAENEFGKKTNHTVLEDNKLSCDSICYEHHPNDSRVTELSDLCGTLTSRVGNVPLLQELNEKKFIEHKNDNGCFCSDIAKQDVEDGGESDSEQKKDVYCFLAGAAKRLGDNIQHNISPTLTSSLGDNMPPACCPQNEGGIYSKTKRTIDDVVYCVADQQDCATVATNICPTLTAMAGMSGNNQPYICNKKEKYQTVFSIDCISNQSSNPYSGCRTVNYSKTLDTTDPIPSKNQGGLCVLDEQSEFENTVENGNDGLSVGVRHNNEQRETAIIDCANDGVGGAKNSIEDNCLTVRKLLPIECERLMGMPDNHTQIHWNGRDLENCPDAPRYKACGNGFCVNVIRWLGERIQMVEDQMKIEKK